MGESDLHQQLKRAATRWLWEAGYAAIAEEVEVPGVGIVDVAAAGRWKHYNPRRPAFEREPVVDRFHVVFIECKAWRSDFLRDQGHQQQFAFALGDRAAQLSRRRRRRARHASGALGKFDTCLIRPHANLHYLLTPPKLLCAGEVPRRWGWLVHDMGHVRVVRRPAWQEVADVTPIEGAIARALTTHRMRAFTAARPVGAPVPSETAARALRS
ncbi:MAG: hypothetical protein HY763_08200 [Planctomycetes bacterium]|nr:hypothetical protein [Planctomycetota bacterium]